MRFSKTLKLSGSIYYLRKKLLTEKVPLMQCRAIGMLAVGNMVTVIEKFKIFFNTHHKKGKINIEKG